MFFVFHILCLLVHVCCAGAFVDCFVFLCLLAWSGPHLPRVSLFVAVGLVCWLLLHSFAGRCCCCCCYCCCCCVADLFGWLSVVCFWFGLLAIAGFCSEFDNWTNTGGNDFDVTMP